MFGAIADFFGTERSFTIDINAMDNYIKDVGERRMRWDKEFKESQERMREAIRENEERLATESKKVAEKQVDALTKETMILANDPLSNITSDIDSQYQYLAMNVGYMYQLGAHRHQVSPTQSTNHDTYTVKMYERAVDGFESVYAVLSTSKDLAHHSLFRQHPDLIYRECNGYVFNVEDKLFCVLLFSAGVAVAHAIGGLDNKHQVLSEYCDSIMHGVTQLTQPRPTAEAIADMPKNDNAKNNQYKPKKKSPDIDLGEDSVGLID